MKALPQHVESFCYFNSYWRYLVLFAMPLLIYAVIPKKRRENQSEGRRRRKKKKKREGWK